MALTSVRTCWTTLGGDPEIAITTIDGELVPASQVLKQKATGSRVEIDGFFAELHPSPDTCRETLATNYHKCLETLKAQLVGKPNTIKAAAVIEVSENALSTASDEEVDLGCEPDIDAYTGLTNKIKVEPRKLKYRTGGGHMHFGKNCSIGNNVLYVDKNKWVLSPTYEPIGNEIVKVMDYLCGLPCVLLDTGNGPAERRKLYGKAGSYRIQKWGIEYRVLSNFWLQHASLMSVAYLLGRVSLVLATEFPGFKQTIFNLVPEDDVRTIIDENNEDGAKDVLKRVGFAIQKLTDFPVVPFIHFVHEIGKESIYPDNIWLAWGWGSREEWFGAGKPGMHNFIGRLPASLKKDYTRILQREAKNAR